MITWTCHVCGKERPDDKISVVKKPLVIRGEVIEGAEQNIRYCNDNSNCYEGALEHSHIKESEE